MALGGIYHVALQIAVNRCSDIETPSQEQVCSCIWVYFPGFWICAQGNLHLTDNPINKMRCIFNICETRECHLCSQGFYLLDNVGRNWAIINGLISKCSIDMHIECQHLLQYVILACQGEFYMICTQCRIIADRILRHARQERSTCQRQEWIGLPFLILIEISNRRNTLKI